MKKVSIVLVVSLVLVALLAGTTFAGTEVVGYVTYTDTNAKGMPDRGNEGSLIFNGDFSLYENNKFAGWETWEDGAANYVTHYAYMDYALPGSADANPALGFFIRNVGGGAHYAYAATETKLERIEDADYYWVQVHVTAWQEAVQTAYNSVAWYGFGTAAKDPSSVSAWYELYPDVRVCPNGVGICNHLARKETRWIEPNSYLYIKVGHKWPEFNVWTVFGIDDIAINHLSGPSVKSGFIDDGDVTWDPAASR